MELTLDPAAVRTSHTSSVNDKASAFVADLEDSLDGLKRPDQTKVFDKLSELVSDPEALKAFINGESPTSSPPKALGAGSSTGSSGGDIVPVNLTQNEKNLLDSIRNASPGQQLAIMRIMHDGSSGKGIGDKIDVENDGTPSQVKSLTNQVTQLTTQRDNALADHLKEKDPKNKGSLAEQLETAKTAAATPADMVKKADIKPLIDEAVTAANALSTTLTSNTVKGKKEVVDKVKEISDKVG